MAKKGALRKNKMKDKTKRALIRLAILIAGVFALLGLTYSGYRLFGAGNAAKQLSNVAKLPMAATKTDIEPPEIAAPAPVAPQPIPEINWDITGPVQQDINSMQFTPANVGQLGLPANGRVDISYFNTATFIGDSLTQGLQIYSTGIPNATYCAYRGISPKSVYDGSIQTRDDGTQEIPMDAIVASAPDYVYILLGANAMVSMTDEAIISYYSTMLDEIRAVLSPNVFLYVQSITAVRPDNEPEFDMNRINGLNQLLAELAYEKDANYINLNEFLIGEDGYLKEEYAQTDGYHLNADGYAAWRDYLETHTAYHPRVAYVEPPLVYNEEVVAQYNTAKANTQSTATPESEVASASSEATSVQTSIASTATSQLEGSEDTSAEASLPEPLG